jgi:FixJ family two-component response regulator
MTALQRQRPNSASSDAPATVFVIDDDPSVRDAIGSLLLSVGLNVEMFGSAGEFLDARQRGGPCCLVLDIRLPGRSGLEFQDELSRAQIDLPVIFITGHGDIRMSVRAMKAGAVEFLTKPFQDQDLLDAIQAAIAQDRAALTSKDALLHLHRHAAQLTPREREVMRHVVSGRSNKQTAADLGVSEITVKAHRGNVMRKMRARSITDLVRMADKLASLEDAPGNQYQSIAGLSC